MDLVPLKKHSLTRAQFEQLADVPPEEEWLANITNLKTRRAYKEDVREFIAFTALQDYMRLRSVGRSHIISWRKDMERRGLAPATVRRKLSALSSLFDYLCERNAVTGNPVDGVKRPMANGNEGSTPALGDAQARKLLEAPPADTLKGVRDRAILATLAPKGCHPRGLFSCRSRAEGKITRPERHRRKLMSESESGQVTRSAAEVYEEFFVPALFQPWATRLTAAAEIRPGQCVLDVACGTG